MRGTKKNDCASERPSRKLMVGFFHYSYGKTNHKLPVRPRNTELSKHSDGDPQ